MIQTKNFRDLASKEKGIRRTRSLRIDSAVLEAYQTGCDARVILIRGRPGKEKGGGKLRLLDPEYWRVVAYDPVDGNCRFARSSPIQFENAKSDPEVLSFKEGEQRRLFIIHRTREWKMRAKKLEEFATIHGRIFCEVSECGFDFEKRYGNLGKDFAHVHHKAPLGKAPPEGMQVLLQDLAVVCPNCHAMIHRGGQCRSLADLGELISRKVL